MFLHAGPTFVGRVPLSSVEGLSSVSGVNTISRGTMEAPPPFSGGSVGPGDAPPSRLRAQMV
eukprot:1951190-Prymnesium_polylepis.1